MQHYFVPSNQWTDNEVIITGNDFHHITRVMRMKTGDPLYCNRQDGHIAHCEIKAVTSESVIAHILEWHLTDVEIPVKITIAQALPKADKLDYILQKGTELGASEFLLFQGQRSIAKWDQKKIAKKMERYQKIVKEAGEQSHRSMLPRISFVPSINELCDQVSDFEHKFIAYEETTRAQKHSKLYQAYQPIKTEERVIVCIGPEGGFSQKEVTVCLQNDFTSVRLGPRILRTETAAMYALATLSYHFEEME